MHSSTVTFIFASIVTLVSGETIEGSYIIKLKGDTRMTIDTHLDLVKSMFNNRAAGNEIKTVYRNLDSIYHAKLTSDVMEKVQALPEVEYVEKDSVVKINTVQANAPWGLARISQKKKLTGSSYNYTYAADGTGVFVYIVDTGIMIDHPEFEGRAVFGAKFAGSNNKDENGHGTHCAGTVGSKSYGVAKNVTLVAVRVLDGSGSGTNSGVISGIDWVSGDKKGLKGNVISMSLGGGKSQAVNDAVEAAIKKGIVVVVAGGNDNRDACNYSPASASNAITVGASDINDARASFSNYGKCIDVFAPGVNIKSTWNNGDTKSISGTSMATPHVAGLAAYFLSQESATPAKLAAKIVSLSTKNAITNPGPASPNLFVYNNVA